MKPNTVLSSNIKNYRKQFGLTQEVFAEYLGISREEVNYYENDNRPIPSDVISKAAKLFGVDEYDLFEENETLSKLGVSFAFRAEGFSGDDLKIMANFKKIALNYLKMKIVLKNNE